jgi:transcriptional regulator with XRE-family HTH domain
MSQSAEDPATPLEHEENEGPPPERAGVVDEQFAAGVREQRELLKMSQGELARRMDARGFPYYQQTVRRIEDGRRKVSVGEAKAIAEILKTTMERLTWPTQEASVAALLDMSVTLAARAYGEVGESTRNLLWALGQLKTDVAVAEGMTWTEPKRIQMILRQAEAALKFTPEGAVASVRAERDAEMAARQAERGNPAGGTDGDERS